MRISLKIKLLILIFLSSVLSLFFASDVFAAIAGCLSSNQPPALSFKINETKLADVIVNIKDPTGIAEYKIYWKNTSNEYVECPTKYHKITKVSNEQIKVTFLHSGMAGKKNVFKIYAKDADGVPASRIFILGTKTVGDAKCYVLDCFPRVTDFTFNKSTNKLSFKVTDQSASTSIKVTDLYDNKNVITTVNSTSVTKTVSVDVTKLKISKSGVFYIQIYAKDKNGTINNMFLKFKCKPTGKLIAQLAKNFKGCKYVSGATGPSSFDCSGLVQYVYKQFNVSLPRTSSDQKTKGKSISKSNAKEGDILCYPGHVAIYIGGKKLIHAANSNRGVVIDDMTGSYYWGECSGARRIL